MAANAAGTIKGLANIKKIVVLMFENRSFDHIFGAFPGADGLMLDGKVNENYYNLPNPLKPPCAATNAPVYPVPIDATKPLLRDFTHDFGDGMMPDLFGPIFKTVPASATPTTPGACYYSGYAAGSPLNQAAPGQKTYPATNSGFYTTYERNEQQGQAALQYFSHEALKIFPTLASNFVLCDNWYCDMPGHTKPNRLFMHCGTTGNLGIDDTDGGICESPTIFDTIDQVSPADWKMYTQLSMIDGQETLGMLDTRFLNANAQEHGGALITEFATDCEAGVLPFYSFIMCWLPGNTPYTDTSMHPGSMLQGGENLLAAVYNTLRNSKSWDETLLVVTFDENGGIYDHVMPPRTTPPDDKGIVTAPVSNGDCGNDWDLYSQFDFSLLGPRIPAMLISPWLNAGIDHQQYQNTSVLRLLVDKLNTEFKKDFPPLTERDKNAPSLESAFAQFGTDTLRDDCPAWIEPYAKLPTIDPSTGSDAIPYSDGKLSVWNPPASTSEAAPVSYITELLNIYMSPLQGHSDSGKRITRTFATNAEVAGYMRMRVDAAERFRASAA